ncbi:unnamed protein product [Mytilus coruscus]|uniref:Ketoreductase (KR) domain-containing protein n=1 Tax=Mytilus coruscus TaxID=42192 RepID=A0A6J8F1V6_MYTCO|nr:unnamed protein product [Mytilus coruscus]
MRSSGLVIAFSPFLNQDARLILQMNNVEVKVIQIDDVLSKENFVRVTPLIFKFWNKHNLDVEIFRHENNDIFQHRNSQHKSDGILQIPTKTLSMKFDNIRKYNNVKIQQDTLFRNDGCYIVVGGLTGLGWEIISFAAGRGADEVISLSRRNVSIQQQNEFDMLFESTGCRIRAMVAYITVWDENLKVSRRLVNPDVWKYLFSQLHAKHNAIRTLFLPNQEKIRYGIRKHTMDSDEATVNFIEVPMKALDHDHKVPSDIKPYLFDPSKELPFRIMFSRNAKKCIVRLVFNHLLFDLMSVMIVVRSILDIGQSETSDGHSSLDKDFAVLYEQKFHSQKDELIRFWEHQTPAVLFPMSLKGISGIHLNPKHFDFTKVTIDQDIALELMKFMKKQNLKLFDVVVSLYRNPTFR